MRSLFTLVICLIISVYANAQQVQSARPLLRDGIGVVGTTSALPADNVNVPTGINTPTPYAHSAADQRIQNLCGVTASFTPANDTFFSASTFIQFTNTSTNAQSLQWQINGINWGGGNTNSQFFQPGTYQIRLIAINGACRDTATAMIVCTGFPTNDPNYFSGAVGMDKSSEKAAGLCVAQDSGFVFLSNTDYKGQLNGQLTNGLLVKLRRSGCIEWSRLLYKPNTGINVSQAHPLRDSGFLVAGAMGRQNFLVRMDKTGNPVWTREHHYGALPVSFSRMYEMQDGNLIGTTSPFANGFSVVKMDPAGNVIWDKFLQKVTGNYDYATTVAICEWRQALYVMGQYRYPDSLINVTNPFLTYVVKMDPGNGQVIWTRELLANGTRSLFMQDMQPYDTTLMFSGINYNTYGASVIPLLAFIDSSGSLVDAKVIQQSQYVFNFPTGVRAGVLPGGNLMVYFKGQESINLQPGFINHSYVIKLNGNASVQSSRARSGGPNELNTYTAFNGRSFGALGHNYSNLMAWLTSSENLIFIKQDSTGLDYNCSNPTTFFSVQPFALVGIPTHWVKDTILRVATTLLSIDAPEVFPQIRSLCPDFIDSCAVLRVTGPLSVCSLTDEYTYRAGRNSKCPQPVQWAVEGPVTIVRQTDSSLTIRFLGFGSSKVSAMLRNSCNPAKDSIMILAASRSGAIALGPDTTICNGNTLRLRAGPGFMAYQWQDGTNDSTLSITTAGQYWVRVIDSCGNVLRDTVVVSAAAAVPLNIGSYRAKCNGDTLQLTAPGGFIGYTWTNSTQAGTTSGQQIVINPSVSTAYFLKAEKTPGCFGFDTLQVIVHQSPGIQLGNDVQFCAGDSVTFNAGSGFVSYYWNGLPDGQQRTVNTAGQYFVAAMTAQGCKSYDTVRVLPTWPLPVVSIKGRNLICYGQNIMLDAGNVNGIYAWSTGSSAPQITVATPGSYNVSVTDIHGCIGRDTFTVTGIVPIPADFLTEDTMICNYGTLELRTLQPYSSYVWSTGATTSSIIINSPGKYLLEVKDANDCSGIDSIQVRLKECLKGIFVPGAFTPNGDGRNDTFRPLLFGPVQQYSFSIFNRWGQQIFSTSDTRAGWDGTIRGLMQDSGVFIWVCTYTLNGSPQKMERGTLVLIR